MRYVKQALTSEMLDSLRVNLSVQPNKLSPEPCCDFCGQPRPVYTYQAKRMTDGTPTPCWRWSACRECSNAVDTDDWDTIEEYMMERLSQTFIAMGYGNMTHNSILMAVKASLEAFHTDAVREG